MKVGRKPRDPDQAQQLLPHLEHRSQKVQDAVCAHVARGGSLAQLAAAGICARSTVRRWRSSDANFNARYREAVAKAKAKRCAPLVLAYLSPANSVGSGALSLRSIFREWFGVTATEAGVLAILYQATGQWRSARDLAAELGASVATMVRAHIPSLRGAMEAEAIDCADGAYRLTEIGMGECQAVVLKASAEFGKLGAEMLGAA